MAGRVRWAPVISRAAQIVNEYGGGVTLRQLFYRLVSEGEIPNTESAYKTLSSKTAEARREGSFPALVDQTRSIQRPLTFNDPQEALEWLGNWYKVNRQDGQDVTIYLGAEKATMQSLLEGWFGEYGFPVILLRGYGSQTYLDHIRSDVLGNGVSVCIYAGDFDPSGEDIVRDFNERTYDVFDKFVQIAILPEQIEAYELTPFPGKVSDPRSAGFEARYGELIQVEIEALDPDSLRQLYQEAIDAYMDMSIFEAQKALEATGRQRLEAFAKRYDNE